MSNQEYQLQRLRVILKDESLDKSKRVAAQKSIMKILGLVEKETEGKYPCNNLNPTRRLKNG